ncbi:MAG TPA: hypothetical protein VNN20_06300 [Thermodesulfobacteriota bacterium]|nr:hypothetical protein [Thermodesulfobacteriota bacterium]
MRKTRLVVGHWSLVFRYLIINFLFLVSFASAQDRLSLGAIYYQLPAALASDVDTGLSQGESFSGQLESQNHNSLIPKSSNLGNVPQYSDNGDVETPSPPEAQFIQESANTHPVFVITDSDPTIMNYESIQQAIADTYKDCQIQDQCVDSECTTKKTTVSCSGEIRCELSADCFDTTYQPNSDFEFAQPYLQTLANVN